MSIRSWAAAAAILALLVACSRRSREPKHAPAPGAAGEVSVPPRAVTPPPRPAPVFPTPPPEPQGGVSEVRVAVGPTSPAQVLATLAGRKSAGAAEADCGSGPTAELQCVDLVVAGLPKRASLPKIQVFAKKRGADAFVGPCPESADGVDCAGLLGESAAIRMVGRKPRLEFTRAGFQVRWRALNLASEPHDVKLVVVF
jgi:hypothetical protein